MLFVCSLADSFVRLFVHLLRCSFVPLVPILISSRVLVARRPVFFSLRSIMTSLNQLLFRSFVSQLMHCYVTYPSFTRSYVYFSLHNSKSFRQRIEIFSIEATCFPSPFFNIQPQASPLFVSHVVPCYQ